MNFISNLVEWIEDNIVIIILLAAALSIGIYFYFESKTPDAYINGKPVKFVSRCVTSHVDIILIPVSHYNGKTSYTTLQPTPHFVCDQSVIDTIYIKLK